ncbi:MAG: Gfo/Idh/MocA family oxidoreductase [Phycisphaeraceae bacterium]
MSEFRLGILATGNIARQFAEAMPQSKRVKVVAVASRSEERARSFAERYGIARAYGSYGALLDDPGIDGVYIATPNDTHVALTLRALEAGKHVLCEKPLAPSEADAERLFAAAESAGRLLMEGFMYLSHPATRKALSLVNEGAIGTPRLLRLSFCYRTRKLEGNTRFRPELLGGALMDVGCYATSLALTMAGERADALSCSARLHATGVDELAVGHLTFPGGLIASFEVGMGVQTDNAALLCGDEGYVRLPVPWKPGERSEVELRQMTGPRQDGAVRPARSETFSLTADGPLFALEADDFALAARGEGKPSVSGRLSIDNAAALETLRRLGGLAY